MLFQSSVNIRKYATRRLLCLVSNSCCSNTFVRLMYTESDVYVATQHYDANKLWTRTIWNRYSGRINPPTKNPKKPHFTYLT